MDWETQYQQFLQTNPHPRQLKSYTTSPGVTASPYCYEQGKKLLNFSSSDYLGLAAHPELIVRSHDFAKRWGVGATSSRLVVGNFACYDALESKLARALHKPAALILGSGYQTNLSVLEALLDERVLGQSPLVFCDRHCHISLLAMTKHTAQLQRFRHNDLTHLQMLLEKYADSSQPKLIIVESLYSMDGDMADLPALIQLARQCQALLYVDDAHSVGVYGPEGFGLAAAYADDIDIIMGTFSKGLGSFGGYIGCSTTVRDYLINKCRGLIYSTGLSPAVLGAIDAAIDLLPQLTAERTRILQQAQQLRDFMRAQSWDVGRSSTHIVPWVIGDANETVRLSEELATAGILGTPIRPPSVAVGESRIRFCVTAAHGALEMEQLQKMLERVNALSVPQ